MKDMDISLLLKKAEELRALFVLGQRVIPFLEEIFLFVNDIKPLLDEINRSIQENLKKMPNASKQLSKVTEATEMATTEIMDIVDGLFYKSDIISSNLNKLSEINNSTKGNPLKIIELISKAIDSNSPAQELITQLSDEIKTYKKSHDTEFSDTVFATNDMLQSIKDDSNSIMMALQVQDITSQQIAAVNHLLQTVQGKLSQIMEKFQNSEISDLVQQSSHEEQTNITELHRTIAFDPEAVDSITNKDTRQGDVDDLINSFGGSDPTDDASQDDIDSLFAGASATVSEPVVETPAPPVVVAAPKPTPVAVPAPAPKPAPAPAPPAADDWESFSQDDIDALFGN
jgi:chemotaxis regulatin CheY-phosphate phosphatase CheZ